LLRCSFCDLVNLDVQVSGVPDTANVGDQFTFTISVSNNGECAASATILTNQLPAGLRLVDVSYNQGISTDYNPVDGTLVWRVGSVRSGTVNAAVISMTVTAAQPGQFQGNACGIANYERFDASNCAVYPLTIQGIAPPAPASLSLLNSAYGLYQLRLTGDQGATYQIQTSSDLRNWLLWTNAPGPLFYIEIPRPVSPAVPDTFYRALWP
jgi:uncharacterized repeat protein (TIGR01451 family)